MIETKKQKRRNMKLTRKLAVFALVFALASCNGSGKKTEKENSHENIKYANDMNSFNQIINGNTPVLVDFYADWCAPCRMMTPILEQVSEEVENVKILKVNVDKNQAAARQYRIQSIPTLMLFQNGKVKWQGVGVIQADAIKQILKTKSE